MNKSKVKNGLDGKNPVAKALGPAFKLQIVQDKTKYNRKKLVGVKVHEL